MGLKAAAQHDDAAVDNSAPSTSNQPNFDVDLTDSRDVKSTLAHDPRCEVGPSNNMPEIGMLDLKNLTEGKPSDILGPAGRRDSSTLPQTMIMDGDTVLADGAPPKSKTDEPAVVQPDGESKVVPPTEEAKLVPSAEEAKLVPSTEEAKLVPSNEAAKLVPSAEEAKLVPSAEQAKLVPSAEEAKLVPSADEAKLVPSTEEAKLVPSAEEAKLVPSAEEAKLVPSAEQAKLVPSAEEAKLGTSPVLLPFDGELNAVPKVTKLVPPMVVPFDEMNVVPSDTAAPNVVQLNQNTLESGKVAKREGYYQVAARLLGPGFDHVARKELTNALRDSWKAQPGKENASGLNRGDQLLTQNNMDAVLNSIKDEGLRGRIRERLMSGEAKPPSESSDRDKNYRDKTPRRRGADDAPQAEPKPDQTRTPREGEQAPRESLQPNRKDRSQTPQERDKKPPQITPGEGADDRFRDPLTRYDFNTTDTPKGQLKSPFLRRYDVGDRFEGLTSVYRSGRQTASGLPFDKHQMTAASKEFPFGTVLKITNPATGLEARVVVTDHGPFAGKMVKRPDGSETHARVLDLSVGAANAIGMGFTVKNLQIAVESIPEQGKWGSDRRNIHDDYKRAVVSKVKALSNLSGRRT